MFNHIMQKQKKSFLAETWIATQGAREEKKQLTRTTTEPETKKTAVVPVRQPAPILRQPPRLIFVADNLRGQEEEKQKLQQIQFELGGLGISLQPAFALRV